MITCTKTSGRSDKLDKLAAYALWEETGSGVTAA